MIEVSGLRKSFQAPGAAGRSPTSTRFAAWTSPWSAARSSVSSAPTEPGRPPPSGCWPRCFARTAATPRSPARTCGATLREVRKRIGFVAQASGTYDQSTARRDLVHQARMYGVSKSAAKGLAEQAIAAFQLDDFADRRIGTYSGGQRRRLDVALGVIHSPQVIFLDEPTTGLDPQSRARMWEEVRRLRDEGMTIFLTTHYLDEADALCDRISIIDGGLIVAEGTPSDLKREISGDVVIVDLAAPDSAGAPEPATMLEAAKILADQPCVQSCETIDSTLRLYVDSGATAIPQIMRALTGKGIEPGAIETRRPSLDDVFLAKTGRTLAD